MYWYLCTPKKSAFFSDNPQNSRCPPKHVCHQFETIYKPSSNPASLPAETAAKTHLTLSFLSFPPPILPLYPQLSATLTLSSFLQFVKATVLALSFNFSILSKLHCSLQNFVWLLLHLSFLFINIFC